MEKWWWLDETPQGFCPDSAYLAIQCLAIRHFTVYPPGFSFPTRFPPSYPFNTNIQ
jgi:hypothetical protein